MSQPAARWEGRNVTKDQVRARVWGALESSGAAVGSPWSAIPNYKGADDAARILAGLPEFRDARVVKSNPDPAQGPFRLAALRAGKKLYTPVPELVQDTPFVLLDPEVLEHIGVAFEEVENAGGFLQHGLRVEFRDIRPIDFFVVGCVAVTRAGGRTGKGAGFADLELGIMRHYGSVTPTTPIATTVHDLQVVDDADVVMEAHDTPLDYVATPSGLVETKTTMPRPGKLDWNAVREDQYRDIPFLRNLRGELAGY